jgi:hypothetical protein
MINNNKFKLNLYTLKKDTLKIASFRDHIQLKILFNTNAKFVPALNWAKCWKLLFLTQSAVNHQFSKIDGIFRDYKPSLICYTLSLYIFIYLFKFNLIIYKKYLLQFYHYYSINQSINNNTIESKLTNSEKFSYYLTGLIEGDGTIIVPKIERTKGRLNYPSIQIIFHLKDLPLALLIQKELGHGSLARKKGVNAYVLTINNYKGILLLISLINGKMKTPKIHSLYNLID